MPGIVASNRMPAAPASGLRFRPPSGQLLLVGSVLGSLGAIAIAQEALRHWQTPPTPVSHPTALWRQYRWAWDPAQRRDAALLLAASDQNSPHRRQRLLQGQGWGRSPVAAAVLVQQARTAGQLGDQPLATRLWRSLLTRFPDNPLSADGAYQLSEQNPALASWLLSNHPAHPATLERAVHNQQALHLARWGPAHPGASDVIRAACQPQANTPARDRQLFALALASLGDGQGGVHCLKGATPAPATAIAISRVLLRGDAKQRLQGESFLVAMARRTHPPITPATLEAARLLSEPLKPNAALLGQLPPKLREHSADVNAAQVRLGLKNAHPVFKRWPNHPATWQLQWDLAREALLAGQWGQAQTWLQALDTKQLPEPLAARQLFWLGLSQAKQGDSQAAQRRWAELLRQHPPGYYTWRASVRLEKGNLPPLAAAVLLHPNGAAPADTTAAESTSSQASDWEPLHSGDSLVDHLWRVGMAQEALETWRSRHRTPLDPQTLAEDPDPKQRVILGRLRLGAGDRWGGLDALWRTSLRLVGESCRDRLSLHRQQHPLPFKTAFRQASQTVKVHEALLRAIAKQESRYSPGVQSPVGARGLMQLMPDTAAELAGRTVSTKDLTEDLNDPAINTKLGALYLQRLLKRWGGNPWLTIASYNAGPGAAGGWRSEALISDPELWAERIPFPETRIYTKKVLGNLWAYLRSDHSTCRN